MKIEDVEVCEYCFKGYQSADARTRPTYLSIWRRHCNSHCDHLQPQPVATEQEPTVLRPCLDCGTSIRAPKHQTVTCPGCGDYLSPSARDKEQEPELWHKDGVYCIPKPEPEPNHCQPRCVRFGLNLGSGKVLCLDCGKETVGATEQPEPERTMRVRCGHCNREWDAALTEPWKCPWCGGSHTPERVMSSTDTTSDPDGFHGWREWDYQDMYQMLTDNDTAAIEAHKKGREEHQGDDPNFQGDPIAHAAEEVRDTRFYLWQAARQRDALVAEVERLRAENRRLREMFRRKGRSNEIEEVK